VRVTFFRPWISVLRSRSFQVAAAFALAVTTTVLCVFAVVFWEVTAANLIQIKKLLEDESRDAVESSTDQIREQLALRLTRDLRRLDFVGLYDAKGSLLYGNYNQGIPVPVDGRSHQTSVSLQDGSGGVEDAVFVARRRADGGVLMLGRSLVGVYRLRVATRSAFMLAVIPVVLIAVLGGIAVALRASRRLYAIQQAINRVMLGEVQARLPADKGGDDVGRLTRAVNQMLDEVGRLIGQLKSVGDNIAHDLRAPLAATKGRLERGLEMGTDADVRQAATEAVSDLDRALKAVAALLRISELESGLRRSSFETVDLVALCLELMDFFEPLADAKSIRLTMQAPPSLNVAGDRALLQEVFLNLVDNALKFTPRGGTVELQVGSEGTLFRVSDNGPGIPPREREHIFKRFYRISGPIKHQGSGLGLSIASTIAELHGFSLRVANTQKPGATFELTSEAPIG
jgi:signal transduction histidine kinase